MSRKNTAAGASAAAHPRNASGTAATAGGPTPHAQRSVAMQNLGCSKNLIDGERILALFASKGFLIVDDASLADVVVVNTCAFIKEATQEAIDTVLEMGELKRLGRCKVLIVSGCFSERYRGAVKKEFPEVDVWAGVNDWGGVLSELIQKGFGDDGMIAPSPIQAVLGDDGMIPPSPIPTKIGTDNTGDNDTSGGIGFKRILSDPLSTQHIKIAEGCSHRCSFCVIPSIRGDFKSRGIDSITQEAKWLYEQGTRELILVAQDTSCYGRDINTNLVKLLESILKNTAFPWIRMMYLHPQLVSGDLLALIAAEKRLCRYFDIPLQHISDKILASMNRSPLSSGIYKLIERIKTSVDNATLRSSFIIGFPDETEKEFADLKSFIQFAKFDKLGLFPFSPEEGTPAYAHRRRCPKADTVQRRCDELMLIQQGISREILEAKVGTDIEVIIDRISDDPDFNYEGRMRSDAPEVDGRVLISSGNFEIGQIATVKIIGASDYDLYA